MMSLESRRRYAFRYEVSDLYEGTVKGMVQAADADEAEEEAKIAAAERGCCMIEDVEVYKLEQS